MFRLRVRDSVVQSHWPRTFRETQDSGRIVHSPTLLAARIAHCAQVCSRRLVRQDVDAFPETSQRSTVDPKTTRSRHRTSTPETITTWCARSYETMTRRLILSAVLACCSLVVLLPTTNSDGALRARHSHNVSNSEHDEDGAPVNKTESSAPDEGFAVNGSRSVLGATLNSIWERVRPYIIQEDGRDLADRMGTFRRRLLTEAEEMVTLFIRAAGLRRPDGDLEPTQRQAWAAEGQASVGGGGRHRTRRDHPLDLPLFKDPDGVPVLEDIKGVSTLQVNGSLAIEMVVWHGRAIVAIINAEHRLSLCTLDRNTYKVTHTLDLAGNVNCQFSKALDDQLLLLCITRNAPYFKENFYDQTDRQTVDVTVYQVKEETKTGHGTLTVHLLQFIPTENPIDLHTWMHRGTCFLMVAEAKSVGAGVRGPTSTTYHTTSKIYYWTGQYFDFLHQLPGTHPTSVRHFKTKDHHFIAMANFINNKGQHNTHSTIFRYSIDVERYVPFQQILTKGAKHIEIFTMGYGFLPHTYLAVANSCEDEADGGCNPYTESRIYRYYDGRFILFQSIPTAAALQWLAIQLESSVLLAVANALTGVKFYQYNGWRFVPTAIQHTAGPFGVGVTSMASVIWNGTILIGVTNQDPELSAAYTPSIYTVSFKRDRAMQEFYTVSERWCEERLARLEEEDLVALQQQVDAAPRNSLPYTFTQSVTIDGNLTVLGASEAHQVYIRGKGQWLPDLPNHLEARRLILQQDLKRAQERILDAIPLAGPVSWPAGLHFAHLDALETSDISSVDNLVAVWINGHDLVGQEDPVEMGASGPIHVGRCDFKNVDVQAGVRVTRLDGRPVSEYVTLNGRHRIEGEVTFLEEVGTARVGTSGTVDGVRVARDSLLLTTDVQNHTGSIGCSSLKAGSVYVSSINGIGVSDLFQSLVTSDASATINGRLVVRGDLVHPKNAVVNVTSNIDLYHPLRTDDLKEQVITGQHRVESVRSQSVRVAGRVNSVRVPEDVFLRRAGYSYTVPSAAFTQVLASSSVAISTALDTITVTDGQLDVLSVYGNQIVTASKTFRSIHLLQGDSTAGYSNTGRRRRRESSGDEISCGFRGSRGLTEAEARREELLWGVRSVATAQDLLSIMASAEPRTLTHSQHSAQFYTRLAQDVPCAFSQIDGGDEGMRFDLQNLNWKEEETSNLTLLRENITRIINNVEKYKKDLHAMMNHPWTWQDVFAMFINIRTSKHLAVDKDLLVLRYLTDALEDRRNKSSHSANDHEECRTVCKEMDKSSSTPEATRMHCLPGFSHIKSVLRRLRLYPSVVSNITELSGNQRQVLQIAVSEHGIRKLLEVIREEERLSEDLKVASVCGTVAAGSREDNEDILTMLESYSRGLKEEPESVVRRVKRAVEPEDTSRAKGYFTCSDFPQHYNNPESVREGILLLQVALQFLYSINSTQPWDIRVTSVVEDVAFETYFRHYTRQVSDIFQSLYDEPVDTIYSLDRSNLTTQTSGFVLLMNYAKEFQPALSAVVQEELTLLSVLLPAARATLTKVLLCLTQLEDGGGSFAEAVDYYDPYLPTASVSTSVSTPSPSPSTPSVTPSTAPMYPSGEWETGSWVLGLVAGYRLEDLQHFREVYYLATSQPIRYVVRHMGSIRNIILKSDLNVSVVNEVDVVRVDQHGLPTTTHSIPTSLVFKQPVSVSGEVTVERVNQVTATEYVTLTGDYVFTKVVTFKESVAVQGNVRVLSTVNNLDLAELRKRVALVTTEHQVFVSSVNFVNIATEGVDCEEGQVLGVSFKDFVLLNETALITGRKTFLEVAVTEGEVHAADLTADVINGVNVNNLFYHSLRKNPVDVQVFLSSEVQLATLLVLQDFSTLGIEVPSTNNVIHLPRLAQRVVYKDTSNVITGGLVLAGNTTIESLSFLESFDAVSSAQYGEGWLLRTPDQVISGQLAVVNINSNDVTVSPGVKIQGVDLLRLAQSCIAIDEPQVINVPLRFAEVVSLAEVFVAGLVQGWDLSEEGVLHNSSSVVFTSSKTFLAPVFILGDFRSTRGISGLDLSSLCERLSVDKLEIQGRAKFASPVNAEVVLLGPHRITSESLGDFWTIDRDVSLTQPMTLQELVTQHPRAVTVNDVDLTDLSTRVLRQTCSTSQVLPGNFHFGFLTTHSLFADEVLTNTLNGRSPSDLQSVFTITGNQVITGHWDIDSVHVLGDLVTSNLVNGMRMTDLCQLRRPCVVHATKTFSEDVIVSGDLDVQDGRTVQGVDVSEAFRLAVSRSSCGDIPGLTTFTRTLTMPRLLAYGDVDGVPVSSDLVLTRNGEQVMAGQLTITVSQGVAMLSEAVVPGMASSTASTSRSFRKERSISVAPTRYGRQ
ncbi:uncharacterized protein [Panulirus ornatus]|uniref:uncharacterized protein n=1 Tax=Panulirus ornatus TaxID=150431 RepID=UPI003A858E22